MSAESDQRRIIGSTYALPGASTGCPFCGCPIRSAVDTYKHRWMSCDSCGNIVRERKEEYLAQRLVPSPLSDWLSSTEIPLVRGLRVLFPNRTTVETPATVYDYYRDALDKGVENTKYAGQYETYTRMLATYGIDLAGRDVLDISGGPGFIAQRLSKIARRCVMSEYDPEIVRIAREKLGIETLQYDFNAHDISELLEGQFDFVFIRYAINFCLDVPKFLASLRRLLRPSGHVFISFVLPTMGTCLRCQFEDFAYKVLFNPETIARMFSEMSFRLVGREEEGRYDYRTGASRLLRALFPAYEMRNRIFSSVGAIMRQDTMIQLYRYES